MIKFSPATTVILAEENGRYLCNLKAGFDVMFSELPYGGL